MEFKEYLKWCKKKNLNPKKTHNLKLYLIGYGVNS